MARLLPTSTTRRFARVTAVYSSKEADGAGTVTWSWTSATRTPGAATATVSCALGTRQGTGVATFAVQ